MLNGILPVYKDRGMTSHDVVFKLRKMLQMKKIGHSGTLDPDVDGVLLILLGSATKVSDYAMDLGKSYKAEVCLGMKTTTEDISGEILEEIDVDNIPIDKIKEVCSQLVGRITQIPPIYSAVKVNGKKLYEYARSGNFDVERPSRVVDIYSIKVDENSIIHKDNKLYFTIDVHCGKGTYIRTIATQIGEMLGLPSCMSRLTRTSSGKIRSENCYTLEQIGNMSEIERESILLRKEFALEAYEFYELPKHRAKQVMNGLRFRKDQFSDLDFTNEIVFTFEQEAIAVYYLKNKDDDLLSVKTTFPKEIV
ncbi:MAG: tRNA pseudouridine(55) synthase TruB [Gemella sp.]|nr:tRNA pseudouridine(55) synthase TruB [Gemella sp.]